MNSSDGSDTGTKQSILENFVTVMTFVMAVGFAIAGVLDGHLWTVVLIPIAWILTALDPQIGRWKHVWE